MEGYIKLEKKMLNSLIHKKQKQLLLWMYLLINAVPDEANVKVGKKSIKLKKGQLITTRKELAKLFNISEPKVERMLKQLKSEHQIEQQTSNKYRVITIKSYEQFFESEHQNEHQQKKVNIKSEKVNIKIKKVNIKNMGREGKSEHQNKKSEHQGLKSEHQSEKYTQLPLDQIINIMPNTIHKEKVSNGNTKNVSNHKYSNSINNKKEKENVIKRKRKNNIDKILQKWNSFAEKNDLPSIRKLTDKRKKKLKIRLKEGFDIDEICKAIEEQPFLLGDNPHQWHINFDWLIENSTNFLKVIERTYQRKKKKITFDMSWAIKKQKELEEKHGKSN